MSKFLFYILSALIVSGSAIAQDMDYSVDKIPDSLKKNANAVSRFEKQTFEVTDIDRATHKIHEVITILNQNSKSELVFVAYGSKFYKLGDVDIRLYDANGKLISKYKKKDLQTYNFGEGLVDDGVRNYIVVPASSFPVTIEKIYEINYRGTLTYPRYLIQTPYVSLMNSEFKAIVPKNLGLRYRPKNTTLEPVKTDDGKNETYTWSVKNTAAIAYEEGTVASGRSYPHILLAPNKFKLDIYEGEMTSWKTFGKWYSEVVAGTDKLSEGKQQFYKNLVKDASTDREKIRIVYDYLQKNFRYVSIQLGIGGQRPLPAEFTDDKKYGDCKGLSNYVMAVLKTMGIKSHLVLINRAVNDEKVDEDFAMNRFNHAILLVPDKKDSIWLECTSKTALFGVLDNTTQNRNAVLITENGGVLINTPVSTPDGNIFKMRSTIALNEDGSGISESSLMGSGEYKEELLAYLSESKRDDQKEYLVRRIGYKQPDDMLITRLTDPVFYNTVIKLDIEKVTEFMAGTKMFLAPHIYKFWSFNMPATKKRERDFYFDVPFQKTDTTIYKLPAGYTIDVLPGGRRIACENAEYVSTFVYNQSEQAVYSMARLELKRQIIPPAQYQSTKEFFDQVLKEESQRIVIKKGEQVKTETPAEPAKLKAF